MHHRSCRCAFMSSCDYLNFNYQYIRYPSISITKRLLFKSFQIRKCKHYFRSQHPHHRSLFITETNEKKQKSKFEWCDDDSYRIDTGSYRDFLLSFASSFTDESSQSSNRKNPDFITKAFQLTYFRMYSSLISYHSPCLVHENKLLSQNV